MINALLASLALIFIGCSGRSLTVPYQPLTQTAGLQCPTGQTVVFQDDEAWQKFWLAHCRVIDDRGTVMPAPVVDFGKYTLVGVFLGSRPSGGYGVSIRQIKKTKSGLEVYVEERKPAPGDIVITMITYPYVLATVDKTELTVRVITATEKD